MRAPEWAEREWAPYRRARKFFWAVTLLYSLFVLLVLLPWRLNLLGGRFDSWLTALAIATLVYVVALIRILSFPCPRCEKPFHNRGIKFSLLNRECLHCGILIGADPKGSGLVVEPDR